MKIPSPVKKVTKALMWIASYELWKLNTKATVFAVKRIRAQKTDDITWGEAVNNARTQLLEEALHNETER